MLNSSFSFIFPYDISMIMCNLFYIPVKHILKQAATWSLISASLLELLANGILNLRTNQYQWLITLTTFSSLTIHFIKGCFSINKQFSIDSFLDWEGHHWVCTLLTCSLQTTASDLLKLIPFNCLVH